MTIPELFKKALGENASDILLREDEPPRLRIDGRLAPASDVTHSREDITSFLYSFLRRDEIEQFETRRELDFSAHVEKSFRTRVNLFIQQEKLCAAIRLIPDRIPTMEEIYLPKACREFTQMAKGLVLATGPTGSGKSTTLASMIDYINQTRPVHVLTIEDPIEFVYIQKMATVSQREVGRDTADFASSLRHAFRQNPDVVMLGEMRDRESMAAAITLAETGHLTFSTLHTVSVGQTINRIIDSFAPHQQDQIRSQLAITLEGIISQRLIPLKNRPGRVAAREVLICNWAVKNLIRENKLSQIPSAIQTGQQEGMMSMTRSLLHLLEKDLITYESALAAAADRRELLEAYAGIKGGHR